MKTLYIGTMAFVSLFIISCAHIPEPNKGRYSIKQDIAPDRLPLPHEMIDPTPIYEPPSRGGNKHYQVFGKHYQVLSTAKNFTEKGIASWYGKKFHGHLTSNGETYDMFAMSAAHKNLPLPTYVRVTNIENGKQAVVRVNDRGPFHSGRIIDLSYAAAYKLGVTQTGTANVKIEALHSAKGYYIEVASGSEAHLLQQKSPAIAALYQVPTQVKQDTEQYRLIAGPIATQKEAQTVIDALIQGGYETARFFKTN